MQQYPYKLRCDFSIGDAIGQVIIWILLSIVTFGLALFVFPYYVPKVILNRTAVIGQGGAEIGRLRCEITLGTIIGNAFIWLILSVITLGLAYFVYVYRVFRVVLMETKIEYNSTSVASPPISRSA